MRLFIAINFSGETRGRLVALCEEMRGCSIRGNFSLPENVHLTLAFLGACDAKQTAAARQAMSAVEFEPFTITIAGGGCLNKGRAHLVFCELRKNGGYHKIQKLHAEICANLSVKGFELEKRTFWPHITLGREVVWKETCNGSRSIPDINYPTIEEQVTKIELIKSERMGEKLTYTPIFEKKGTRL